MKASSIMINNMPFLDGGKAKEVKLKGIDIVFSDTIGRNKKKYPKDILKSAVQYWNTLSKHDDSYRFIFARHPREAFGDEEDYVYLAGLIDNLYFDDETSTLKADVTLLKTVFGQLIRYLIDKGIKVGTSLRGKCKFTDSVENGIPIKVANKLLLTGFDFVTFPSFIVTGASKEHVENVFESTNSKEDLIELVSTFTDEYNVENKDILCKFFGLCDVSEKINDNLEKIKKTNNTNYKEDNMDREELKTLELMKDKLELEKQKLQLEIEKLEAKKPALEDLIKELESKREEESSKIEELRKEYTGLVSLIEKSKAELDGLKANIEELTDTFEKRRRKVVVEYNGTIYDENNRPKIRIVPAKEKVSETPWGEVYKRNLRKLVWLSGSKKVIDACFGLVEDDWKETYNALKYPFRELVPSEKDGYDFDALINYDGLRTAYVFIFGKAGRSLTPDERRKLARRLLSVYRELVRADIDVEIPEDLKNVAEATVIIDDEPGVIGYVFDKLIEHGIVNIENEEEDIREKFDDIDDIKDEIHKLDSETIDYILARFASDIYSIFTSEKVLSHNLMNSISTTYMQWRDNIDKNNVYNTVKSITYGSDENKSILAKTLGLNSVDDVVNLINGICDKLNSDDLPSKLSAIEQIKTIALIGVADRIDYESGEDPLLDEVELSMHIMNENFNSLLYVIENKDDFVSYLTGKPLSQEQATPPQEENNPEEQPTPEEGETPSPTPEASSNTETNTYEKTEDNNEVDETENDNEVDEIENDNEIDEIENDNEVENDSEINEEEEEELMYKEKMEKIIKILSKYIDTDSEITFENVDDVIGNVVSTLVVLDEKVDELEEVLAKAEVREYKDIKRKELIKKGVSPVEIEDSFEKAETMDDVDNIVSELLEKINNEEQKIDIKRKGTASGDNTPHKSDDRFDRLFNRI